MKNNAHWKICLSNKYNMVGITIFYLLPTIKISKDISLDENGKEEDCSFGISFEWLFWSLALIRYWGSVYKNDKKRISRNAFRR